MTANLFVMHEQPSTPLGIAQCVRRISACLPILALLVCNVSLADSYSSLPDTDKTYVKRLCAPVQFQQDTTAYRNCVNQHSAAILKSNRTPVASLNFDEQLSVQQACQKLGAIGSNGYRQCVVQEASSLEGILTTDISTLSDEEIYAVRQGCADTEQGVKIYRQCVNAAVALINNPTLKKTELPTVVLAIANEASIKEIASTAETAFAVAITSNELKNNADAVTAIPTTPVALRADPVAQFVTESLASNASDVESPTAKLPIVQATLEATQITDTLAPQLAAAVSETTDSQAAELDDQASVDTNDIDSTNSDTPATDAPEGFAQTLWAQLLASLEGVTGMNRIILIAALALPLLLIGFWLLMRRRSDDSESYAPPPSRSLADQVRATPDLELHDDTADMSTDMLSTQQLHFADQVEELFSDDDDPVLTDIDASDFADESLSLNDEQTTRNSNPPATTHESPRTAAPTQTSDLVALLANHESEDQFGLVIEFMIYWMAFTDERYESELKRRIFAETEPDDHDLIKRWVLNQDFNAFADATCWLQDNVTTEEREQVLKLLMALLVYEEGITPVQNTMLRFLCNAFGLTHNQLDELFKVAFGHALPPMPRPDKPTWWNKQSPDKLKRWDARSVAQQSPAIQARVKLGLPLSGELNSQEIIERRERAIARCQPENFNLLTSREQQLAESQQAKYNSAAEALMEISV